jgi:hypothetical protein
MSTVLTPVERAVAELGAVVYSLPELEHTGAKPPALAELMARLRVEPSGARERRPRTNTETRPAA